VLSSGKKIVLQAGRSRVRFPIVLLECSLS